MWTTLVLAAAMGAAAAAGPASFAVVSATSVAAAASVAGATHATESAQPRPDRSAGRSVRRRAPSAGARGPRAIGQRLARPAWKPAPPVYGALLARSPGVGPRRRRNRVGSNPCDDIDGANPCHWSRCRVAARSQSSPPGPPRIRRSHAARRTPRCERPGGLPSFACAGGGHSAQLDGPAAGTRRPAARRGHIEWHHGVSSARAPSQSNRVQANAGRIGRSRARARCSERRRGHPRRAALVPEYTHLAQARRGHGRRGVRHDRDPIPEEPVPGTRLGLTGAS
jgi:hypothetical protein